MAPIGEAYFPPLDKCFGGEHQLLTWETCYQALSQDESVSDDGPLKRFLTDPQTLHLLLRPIAPYSAPSSKSKSSFETKTSAINVTPDPHARYNIKQIQDDALWLSQETKIDEIAALRVAVIERQTRPAAQLLQGSTVEQTPLGSGTNGTLFGRDLIQEGYTSTHVGSGLRTENTAANENEIPRKRRLVDIFLSECRHILKCSEYILAYALCSADDDGVISSYNPKENSARWLRAIGLNLLSTWAPENLGTSTPHDHRSTFLNGGVDGIRARLESLRNGCGWSGMEDELEEVEIAWGSNQIIEVIHIMQILQDLLQSSGSIMQAEVVLPWFRLMSECSFFEGFHLSYPGLYSTYNAPLQSLAALISLTILNLPSALELLATTSNSSLSASRSIHSTPYILNQHAANEINCLLIRVAPLATASLAVLAWSIITQNLRELALAIRDTREVRQSLRAADKFGAADSSDTDGAERPSERGVSVIRRRSSTSSDTSQQSTLLEEIYEDIRTATVDDDPIAYLAKNAVEGGKALNVLTMIATEFCPAFGSEHGGLPDQKMRLRLLDLIRACVEFVQYQPALIMATMAAVTGSGRYWDYLDHPPNARLIGPSALLRQDDVLKRKIFLVALSRFPYESIPLLQLCRALVYQDNVGGGISGVWLSLGELDMFTCMLPLDYQSFKTIREDEENDFIELIEDYAFDLNPPPRSSMSRRDGNPLLLQPSNTQPPRPSRILLPCGTQGQIMSNGKPHVVAWNYRYSGLNYVGKILQCASTGGLSKELPNATVLSDIVGEAIGFITVMLSSIIKDTSGDHSTMSESASSMLGQASDGLDRNQDVISIIFQIFENELYESGVMVERQGPLDVLVQCIHFTYALLPIMPDRVWPFLGRSGLVGLEGGQLSAVLLSFEVVTGRYEFLLGCVRLYDSLIEDVILNAVPRKTPTKVITRFDFVSTLGAGVSQSTMEKVLLSLQRTMIDVFESMTHWKFVDEDDRAEIGSRLCIIFEKLLSYCFRVNDNTKSSMNLAGALFPAANNVLQVYSLRSNTDLAIDPLLRACVEGLSPPSASLPARGAKHCRRQCIAVLRLFRALVQSNFYLERSSSHLEERLFKAAGIFTKLYASHDAYKLPVINLLDSLIRSASGSGQQPPSLVSHLGQENAERFLEVISVFDQPLRNDALVIGIWRFLAASVSKQQQWLAHLVLTGTTPRASVQDKAGSSIKKTGEVEPILINALEALRNIDRLVPQKALAMLEFVALAANFWPSALSAIEKYPGFLESLTELESSNKSIANSDRDRSYKTSADYNILQMAAHTADILALYTHHTQQENNPRFARMVFPYLNNLSKLAIATPTYNTSLHSNLRQNVAAKFAGCSIADFKRTAMASVSLGDSYFYDLELANKMLNYEPAWAGRKGQGFAEEFRRANINLSVVEAQVRLFESWKSLLIELTPILAAEERFQIVMAKAASKCLHANTETTVPEAYFERLAQSRADLAFTMLESLNVVESAVPETKAILQVAWSALRGHNPDLGSALEARDANYHRMLLKLVYLALQFHVSKDAKERTDDRLSDIPHEARLRTTNTTIQTVLEILSTTIAHGFRSLTMLVHTSPHSVHTSDFSLVIALLRSCLKIPGLSRNSEHLLNAFSDTPVPRCAATLLSWSDQLAASTSGEPIYGELSVLFVLELSTVPALAESLAVEGILAHMLTTSLVRILQRRAFGPFDHPTRMYAIWARGILPLLLNLLHAIGPPIVAEVAAALNTFPKQLQRASEAFSISSSKITAVRPASDYITLSMAQEAHSLALITRVIRTCREAAASAAVIPSELEDVKWNGMQVREDIQGWLQRRASLRDRIAPSNEREEIWSRLKPTKEGMGDNSLEEKTLRELRGVVDILEHLDT